MPRDKGKRGRKEVGRSLARLGSKYLKNNEFDSLQAFPHSITRVALVAEIQAVGTFDLQTRCLGAWRWSDLSSSTELSEPSIQQVLKPC